MARRLNEVIHTKCLVYTRCLANVCCWVHGWAGKAVNCFYSQRQETRQARVPAAPCRAFRGSSDILGPIFPEMGCQLPLQSGHYLWSLWATCHSQRVQMENTFQLWARGGSLRGLVPGPCVIPPLAPPLFIHSLVSPEPLCPTAGGSLPHPSLGGWAPPAFPV